MKVTPRVLFASVISLCASSPLLAAENAKEGYYGALNLIDTHQKAKSMLLYHIALKGIL